MRGLTLGDPALLGAAAGFSPLSLSPALWLDASDAATITSSAGKVSQWNDKSGNGRNVTQAVSAAQPTTGTTTQNSLNVLVFDGGDSMVASTAADWTFLHDGTDYIIAAVVKVDNAAANGTFLSTRTSLSTTGMEFRRLATSTNIEHSITNVSTFIVVNTVSSNTTATQVLTVLADPNNGTAADRSSIFINAGAAAKGNAFANTPATGNPAAALTIGARAGGTVLMTGRIAEIVLVSDANATEANRVALRDYLNTKWAVY